MVLEMEEKIGGGEEGRRKEIRSKYSKANQLYFSLNYAIWDVCVKEHLQ